MSRYFDVVKKIEIKFNIFKSIKIKWYTNFDQNYFQF